MFVQIWLINTMLAQTDVLCYEIIPNLLSRFEVTIGRSYNSWQPSLS